MLPIATQLWAATAPIPVQAFLTTSHKRREPLKMSVTYQPEPDRNTHPPLFCLRLSPPLPLLAPAREAVGAQGRRGVAEEVHEADGLPGTRPARERTRIDSDRRVGAATSSGAGTHRGGCLGLRFLCTEGRCLWAAACCSVQRFSSLPSIQPVR